MSDRGKRPSFQWYPGDAQRDTALRSCSLEARGLWREMMDLMHDGEPYGHLTAGGIPIDDATLAGLAGISTRKTSALLFELETKKVFSRTESGVIYSRRMVRDEAKRNARAAGGGRSLDNPNVPRPKDPYKEGGKDTFGPSNGGSPAVAVGSLQSAQRGKAQPDLLEAGELLNRIRSLRQTQPGTSVAYITPAAVESLGADVARAYAALGGAKRFLNEDPKETAILISQFGKALHTARTQ